jgi:sterol 22-desaturase
MASTTEYARKILNSPTYAEPCLVHSAKQIILPDNWYVQSAIGVRDVIEPCVSGRVFLTGKEHVDYRRGLNTLFTRKALGYVTTTSILGCRHAYCP